MSAQPHALPLLSGVEALWPLCLGIARQRRSRTAPQDLRAADALSWDASGGFALRGAWDAEAADTFSLLKPLLDLPRDGAPWVIGQLGQSLDGCVATHGGDSNYVNGPEILLHLHRLRALCDAVLVGGATAALDNPQLTTRRVVGPNPVRVVLDPSLRLSPTLRVFTDGAAPTLWACDASHAAEAARHVGAEQVLGIEGLLDDEGSAQVAGLKGSPGLPRLPPFAGLPRLPRLIAALAQRGLRALFVEGGGITVSRFIAQGCIDRLHLSIAPVIIGDGRPGVQLPRSMAMRDCARPAARVFHRGDDVMWDLDLRAVQTAKDR